MPKKNTSETTSAQSAPSDDATTNDEGVPPAPPESSPAPTNLSKEEMAAAQSKASRDGYLSAQREKRDARLRAAGLATAPSTEGPSISVRTAPGPNGTPRKREAGGMMLFGPEECPVALESITYRQYHSIMSNPLLEVKGKAPSDFDSWAKS